MSADKVEDLAPSSGEVPRQASSAGEPLLALDGLPLAGPLEELRATHEKKARMHAELAEEEGSKQVARAYELARAKLEAVLAAPRRPAPASQRDAAAGS
ncbi:MAG TPA: hypothetical protein VMT52_00655 [Planctomycetota bacterium]|nr:hypothetical protein [Planctomycetota bacterium]